MQKLIVANWKMNGNRAVIADSIKHYARHAATNIPEMVLALPAIYLAQAHDLISESSANCSIASQDVSRFVGYGAYTGEINASMLKELDVRYTIIGHSERRQLLQESDSILQAKLDNVISEGITPIFCIGEDRQTRENNSYKEFLLQQLGLLRQLHTPLNQIVIAYEPIWSIGTGLIPEEAQITEAMQFIHTFMHDYLPHVTITTLYGGSVSKQNAAAILQLPQVGGVLVGGASLKVDDFSAIVASGNI